jgi:hypothetical protein
MERHQIIRQAIQQAGSAFVSVNFFKKDGTERQVTFNPRDFNEVKGTGHSCPDPNVFRIRETQNKENDRKPAWRSFDARRVVRIKTKNEVIYFSNDFA